MTEFDPGPPPAVAEHLAQLPSYAEHQELFWYDWGPVLYRGRLDRSARVLCIASDPGPTERVAHRTLVGDAGQRVQGFLAKLGLTRSYVCVNAFAYALFPSKATTATPILNEPAQREWRNQLLSMVVGDDLQAVVAFGFQARRVIELWNDHPDVPIHRVVHPSNPDGDRLVAEWRPAITALRQVVTPDADGTNTGPNYGSRFVERDYAPIPPRDLPFGVPPWLGDDAAGRAAHPRHNNTVERDPSDLTHTLLWHAPPSRPQ
jgi:hypothetical protein